MKLDLDEMMNNSSNLFSLENNDGSAVIINLNLIKKVELNKEHNYGIVYFVDDSTVCASYDSVNKLNEFIKSENNAYRLALKLVYEQLGD